MLTCRRRANSGLLVGYGERVWGGVLGSCQLMLREIGWTLTYSQRHLRTCREANRYPRNAALVLAIYLQLERFVRETHVSMFVFSFLPFDYDHQRKRTRSAFCHVCHISH